MLKANVIIVEELKKFITSVSTHPELLQYFKRTESSFIRNRKLPFDRLVLLVAKLCKRTLSFEIEDFMREMNMDMSYTTSAYVQQRSKLSESFFYCWNMVLWLNFYIHYGANVKRWKGYRVVAGNGSSISLVNNKALREYFGGQKNKHTDFVLGKVYYCYDVLNEMILFPRLSPYRYPEVEMAYESINYLQSDMLMIYDRNFANYKTVALHLWQEKEIKFVIRARVNQRAVKEFIKSRASSAIVELEPTYNAKNGLKKCGYCIHSSTKLQVRLVRVELENTVEVLITNLWEEEGHPVDEFKDLYFLRWGIETRIGFQKNILQLESFSGLTPLAVLQDFYATVFMTNLHSLLIKDAQQTVDKTTKHYKYPMKINNNKSAGRLKKQFISIFALENTTSILMALHHLFVRDIIPIRKGRSYPREMINKKFRGKYTTFSNFKPAA